MQVAQDAVALEVKHGIVPTHGRTRQCGSGGLALVLAAIIPRGAADSEALGAADDAVEGIQLGPIDDGVLMLHQDVAACFEGVEDHGPGIAQLDLKDWKIILPPPFLARRSVILAELKQMTEDGKRSWDFGNAFDFWNVRRTRPLRKAFCQVTFTWI